LTDQERAVVVPALHVIAAAAELGGELSPSPLARRRLAEQLRTLRVAAGLSVTERRLVDDLDPLGEGSDPAIAPGLADITSSAGLTADEAGLVLEQLVVFARSIQEAGRRPWEGKPTAPH
jgi:hypothetical protein